MMEVGVWKIDDIQQRRDGVIVHASMKIREHKDGSSLGTSMRVLLTRENIDDLLAVLPPVGDA